MDRPLIEIADQLPPAAFISVAFMGDLPSDTRITLLVAAVCIIVLLGQIAFCHLPEHTGLKVYLATVFFALSLGASGLLLLT
jgi:hypothetical protein